MPILEAPKCARSSAARQRTIVKTFLAMTTAAAAFLAVAGAAHADDCHGGFRMIKSNLPIACEAFDRAAVSPASVASAPQHTGSNPAPATSPSGRKCVGGFAWRGTAKNGYVTMPMPCS